MKPVVLTVSIPATILSCQVNADPDAVEGPDPKIPELQALDRYRGQWDDEISGRPEVKRSESSEWILRGRFLRQSWNSESSEGNPGASGLTLMTFDTEHEVYRSWAFLGTGGVIEKEGVWDAAGKTFTWQYRVIKTLETVVTIASFVDDAILDWSIVKTDEHGKVVREVVGRSVRRSLPTLRAA